MQSYHLSLNRYFLLDSKTTEILLDRELSKISSSFSIVNLILSAWEIPHVNTLSHAINYIESKGFNSIELILDPIHKECNTFPYQVTYINSTAKMSMHNHTSKWNANKQLALLLTGRIEKQHRIGLLSKLFDYGLLIPEAIAWTFPHSTYNPDAVKHILFNKTDAEISELLNHCQLFSLPDDNAFYNAGTDYFIYTKSASDSSFVDMYSATNFSIISETVWEDGPGVATEKVYRAIAYNHPFIIASSAGTLLYLQNLGFRTFNQYLEIPNYDSIIDATSRLDAIVTNIASFQSAIEQNEAEIRKDIAHNYKILQQIIADDQIVLEQLYTKHGLDCDNIPTDMVWSYTENRPMADYPLLIQSRIDDIASANGFTSADEFLRISTIKRKKTELDLWLNWYRSIKAESWPVLTCRDDFYTLPTEIQEECINVFNFRP